MTRMHLVALGIGGVLIMSAEAMLLISIFSAPLDAAKFTIVATLATNVVGAGAAMFAGAWGHAQGGKAQPQKPTPSASGDTGPHRTVGENA